MKNLIKSISICWILVFSLNTAHADTVAVVVTLKPIHSLVSMVMDGWGSPELLITSESPHDYILKPSDIKKINEGDVVFWVGPTLESNITRAIRLQKTTKSVELLKTPGITLIKVAGDDDDEHHDEDEHEEDEHHDEDEHEEDEHHDEDEHEEHEHEEDEHHDEDEHEEGEHHDAEHTIDAHIWLDPHNALKMLDTIAAVLTTEYPLHANKITENTARWQANIQQSINKMAQQLQLVTKEPFIVFHDGYTYFERYFGLEGKKGVVNIGHSHVGVSAKHLKNIIDTIEQQSVFCMLNEPESDPRLIDALRTKGIKHTQTINPLGTTLQAGPQLYIKLLNQVTTSFNSCLSGL